ncbi:MAG: hypothetical protein SOV85_04945 [Clostridium sp.]|uniref:hypothetical protein n=1 Tax=Clostridium sp. TaxID=1506 RepID=UPI002A75541D|nr:hypothetical protein [Clostridium sp.]MDY2630685.1 hypothetical protein [Clostridium sp.]
MKYSKNEPTKAYKYSKTDTLADSLRINGHDEAATFVTVLEVGSGIILAGESLLKGFKGLFSKSKAISKFFGRSRGLGKKFLSNGLNNKTKINVLDGLKATFTDKKFMNNLVKEFKSNFGKDKKDFIKFIKYQPKRFKQMGLKGITKRIFKSTINQYTEAYSKINKFDGTSKVFKFKLPEKAVKVLEVLNKVKFTKDTATGLLDKKVKIKYYDNIVKIVKGIKDIRSEFNVETVN